MSQTAVESSPKSAKPANAPWVSPYLTVRDAAASLAFYEKAFGFHKRDAVTGPDGKIMHVEMTWKDTLIMFGPECPQSPSKSPASSGAPSPVNLYVYCEDVDAQYARATAAGAKGAMPPQDMFWGDRMCQVIDPDGHSWSFATHTGCTAPRPC